MAWYWVVMRQRYNCSEAGAAGARNGESQTWVFCGDDEALSRALVYFCRGSCRSAQDSKAKGRDTGEKAMFWISVVVREQPPAVTLERATLRYDRYAISARAPVTCCCPNFDEWQMLGWSSAKPPSILTWLRSYHVASRIRSEIRVKSK